LQEKYPSLEIKTLLGNPEAHLQNKRFVDQDLNRQFSEDKLLRNVDEEGMPLTVEELRAQELNEILGPKFHVAPQTDVVVDLHSTTSNMGLCIIIPEGDVVMAQAAAYVLHACGGEHGTCDVDTTARILMHSIPDRKLRPTLSSTGLHGFTIEVGPVPQGVLRHDAVEKTQRSVDLLLEFLHKRNEYGSEAMLQELQEIYGDTSGRVPCYRSAKAKREGEISGKIRWPSDPDNPNFPNVLIHKSLQDRDFHKIKRGDPLFVNYDGSYVNYEGSHGEQVYLIFVNEGGYYYESSGTGIGVAVKAEYDLETATLHEPLAEYEYSSS
jgi:aspartoacylase